MSGSGGAVTKANPFKPRQEASSCGILHRRKCGATVLLKQHRRRKSNLYERIDLAMSIFPFPPDRKAPISGIYVILNKENSKCYIGSSNDIFYRWSQHLRLLRMGTHHSLYLQRAWNKYGETSFLFLIIEKVMPDRTPLLQREQWYFDEIHPVYNVLPHAESSLGCTLTDEHKAKITASLIGKKHSPETIERIRVANQGRVQKPITEETRNKLIAANRGRKHSPETREKMRLSALKRYESDPTLVEKQNAYLAKGRNLPETRAKLTGLKRSDETKAKIGAASRGRKHSQATKAKMSLSRTGKTYTKKK